MMYTSAAVNPSGQIAYIARDGKVFLDNHPIADFHADALRHAGTGAAGNALLDGPESTSAARAHRIDPGDLPTSHAGDLLDDTLGDADLAVAGGQRAVV